MLLIAETCGNSTFIVLEDVIRAAAAIAARLSPYVSTSTSNGNQANLTNRPIATDKTSSDLKQRPPLSDEERQRRRQLGLCLYCGGEHMIANCPILSKRQTSIPLNASVQPYSGFIINGRVLGYDQEVEILIDSGAGASFISANLVRVLGLEMSNLCSPIRVLAFDGKTVVTIREASRVNLQIDGSNFKSQLFVLPHSRYSIILGLDWLSDHNPKIDWKCGSVSLKTALADVASPVLGLLSNISRSDSTSRRNHVHSGAPRYLLTV